MVSVRPSLRVAVTPLALLAAAGVAGTGIARAAPATTAKTDRAAVSPAGLPPGGGAGFHLETPPYVDPVFGDASEYRTEIDRFLSLYNAEQPIRDEFTTAVATALADVEAVRERFQEGGRAGCPVDEIALPYSRAYHLGVAYLQAGKQMAAEFSTLAQLDALGETAALTPDYKYKVQHARAMWNDVLTDYREMHIAFHDELVPEVAWLGCDPRAVLAAGDARGGRDLAAASADGPDPSMPLPPELMPPATPRVAKPAAASVAAVAAAAAPTSAPATAPIVDPRSVQTVAFTIDNRQCSAAVRVEVDGFFAGTVGGGRGGTFRATLGPHDVCVLPVGSAQACGAQGTIHSDYIHEGWTLALRCAAPQE